MRLAHPDAFMHNSERVDKSLTGFALKSMGADSRAFPIFFCAAVDERVWGLRKLDERHWSFVSEAAAAQALPLALASAIAAMAKPLAAMGIELTLSDPIFCATEARLDCGPAMPTIPFSSMVGGYWGQGSTALKGLAERACALAEAAEIAPQHAPSSGSQRKTFSI